MTLRPLALALWAVLIVADVPPAPAQTQAPSSLMERTVAAYAADVRGIIGLHRHFTTVVQGGPVRHTEESDSGFVMNDGAFVRIRYYRVADDGKEFSAQQLQQRESETNRDWAAGKACVTPAW